MKNILSRISFIVCLLLNCTLLFAFDEPEINNLTVQNGLAGETVFKIFKGQSGLIWLGTSNGLSCFNGVSLRTYNASSQKLLNAIIDITQTQDKQLYFSTRNGVFKLNPNRDQLERIIPTIKCYTSALASDGNTLYIGTDEGLYVYNGKQVEHYLVSRDIMSESNIIKDIFVDSQHHVWLVTNRDLFLFDSRRKVLQGFNINKQIHFVGNLHVLTAVGNKIYIGSNNDGIFVFDISSKRITRYTNIGCNVITDLSSDGKFLYAATDGNGAHIISLRDNKVVQSFNVNTSPRLQDNSVYSFMHDASGVNWFGYFRQGLSYNYYVKPLFHIYSSGNFTSRNINVRSFCINGPQKIIGTRNGLYFIDENKNIVKYYSAAELGGSIVTSICEYNHQYFIATYDGGVSVLNPSTLQIKRFDLLPGLIHGSFSKLVVSPNNELWMGSNQGVFVYNAKGNKIINYTQENSQLYDSYVNNLMFDRQGRCWISTQKGLCLYNPQDKIIRSSGFPSSFFNGESELNCTQGEDQDILCFSFNGLFKTNEDMTHFGAVNLSRKIYNNYISFVLHDKWGSYWIGTEHGLFRFDKGFKAFQHYGNDYNLHSLQFSIQSCDIDNKNNLWIGSDNGLVYANIPLINKESNTLFSIIPDNLCINGNRVILDKFFHFINNREIKLSWNLGSDILTFKPVLLNYGNPNGRYFEYRFNSQKEWTLISGNDFVVCRHLGIGTNKLYIRIAGSKHIMAFDIKVIPSIWAVIEFILFLSLVIGLWIVLRNKSILKRIKGNLPSRNLEEPKEDEERYKRVKMDEAEYKEIYGRLLDYIEKNKPYLDPSLKMSDLANALNSSTFKLSQLLNLYVKQNYYDFINNYRLEEFKRRVSDPSYSKYTITALGEQCGFKKTSFFSTFKKIQGITPAEYLHQIETEKNKSAHP